MIHFFLKDKLVYVLSSDNKLDSESLLKLQWLFGAAEYVNQNTLSGIFVGPRSEMITPWSTNAVEITQNMGICSIDRIEQFVQVDNKNSQFDPMMQNMYFGLSQDIFLCNIQKKPVELISNIADYNNKEGLALTEDEIEYLTNLSKKLNRQLTDSEVFGFSQVNSEHCRHKIFNGKFIINGSEKTESLFELIKKTSKQNPNFIVSAYKDNVAFIDGPKSKQFAPLNHHKADFFEVTDFESVISLKAETHNFPTTVEPFNGAATGSGGEIRDRMAGGKGSMPISGSAVYMTSYPRIDKSSDKSYIMPEREWLYQSPIDILIKASNGASDYGNKFGQPLINGSLLTFEHFENGDKYGYDKVIMLAGGIGYAKKIDSIKEEPKHNEIIVVLGGDNYRIGMGGGAVSSVATGQYKNNIELNAVQRSNPEMQKRVYNVIRAMAEMDKNPIISIHDHGAGGHLNSLSELVEATGGVINIDKLPIGDQTLSDREIIGNESQERMGLIISDKDIDIISKVAKRERSPIFIVGKTNNNHRLEFVNNKTNEKPIDLELIDMFGKPPQTVMIDETVNKQYTDIQYNEKKLHQYLENTLKLESVACKDWLTNKVDRSVTGKVALQQTAGTLQLPLNNLGVVAIDYQNYNGIATSIGHAPIAGLICEKSGSILSIAEALTNIVWAPLTHGLKGVSLSANWMWACRNKGEDTKLYNAVEAASKFAIELGINIPTGKDSLSMTQKYHNNEKVLSPGTVIISAVAQVSDITKCIKPVIQTEFNSSIIYIDFSNCNYELGGSSFAQSINKIGNKAPTVANAKYFSKAFNAIQHLINKGVILAGHDISAGGMITTLLEMTFAQPIVGLDINLDSIKNTDIIKILFSENPGVIIQVNDSDSVHNYLTNCELNFHTIGRISARRYVQIRHNENRYEFDINNLRNIWYKTSYLFDKFQTNGSFAAERFNNYDKCPLSYIFNDNFSGYLKQYNIIKDRINKSGIRAAIIREKGVNGDREMAWALYLAGFDVKDVHMTDLISGEETLNDVNLIVFVGGFSNSDVLGSAKGWAGAFIYNQKANKTLKKFYNRHDTLSLGICNGCQLMIELELLKSNKINNNIKMLQNKSNKFESAFINVNILENEVVMLKSLANSRLGVWIAHGEGQFSLPLSESDYIIPIKYSFDSYPANPNGSDYSAAAIASADGRHLAMMPHIERSINTWNWAYYPNNLKQEVSPWIEAFINAKEWIKNIK